MKNVMSGIAIPERSTPTGRSERGAAEACQASTEPAKRQTPVLPLKMEHSAFFQSAGVESDEDKLIFTTPTTRLADGDMAKRLFDITFAITLLIVMAPVLVAIYIGTRLSSPGPAIFRQDRIGRDGKLFKCLKFRSMVIDADIRLKRLLEEDETARQEWARDQKLRNDPRITQLGHFLRRTSLDELPQLWNILRGDMSVVGPRPIVEAEAARYGIHLPDYCSVRPGLTGPWQIGGRNDVSYEQRVQLDVGYVRGRSFTGDLAICFATITAVTTSKGCY